MNQHTLKGDIDPDALTTDPDLRTRQLYLKVWSARANAEEARVTYVTAMKQMRQAEIQMNRFVNEQRAAAK